MKMHLSSSLHCGRYRINSSRATTCSKGQRVGLFLPDLVLFEKIVVDTKVIDRITDFERGQMLNYLRITKLRVGVILNFQHAKLDWERIVL